MALSISAVAAYFSVFGLIALFAATAIPVLIMGTVLEVGKIVAASWLHRHWSTAPFLLKAYLTLAVVVLMGITSIGIYGFLSKGHLEQQAPIGTLESQIDRNILSIKTYTDQIAQLRTEFSSATTVDDKADEQRKAAIQAKIDEVLLRLAPIEANIEQKKAAIAREEAKLKVLDDTIANFNRVGAVSKGRQALEEQQPQREAIDKAITALNAEIIELENQKIDINSQIAKLKTDMFTNSGPTEDTSKRAQLESEIARLQSEISTLEDTNLELKLKITETTAKIGPLLYVANLFGIADPERAVQMIIALIMFAFDPVAIALVIGAQWSFLHAKPKQSETAIPTGENHLVEDLKGQLQKLSFEFKNKIDSNDKLITNKDKLIKDLSDQLQRNQELIDIKEKEIQELKGDEEFQFVTGKLRGDPNLTKGLKDLIEQADNSEHVDLNEGVPVQSSGARTVVKQISNPTDASRANWLNNPSSDDQ